MSRKLLILLLILGVIVFTGCNNKENESINTNSDENIKTDENKENQTTKKEEKSNEEKTDENKIIDSKNQVPSPLSGIYADKEKVNRRPVAIMFDNLNKARWQAGLKDAEIVYEFLAEGKITRYMGIFLVNDPEVIGPVRSARPYFISALLEYDPLYVRCGGSPQAKADVNNLRLADVDCLSTPNYVFYRYYDTGKTAPNNLYTSMDSIRKYQSNMGYRKNGKFDSFKFTDEEKIIKGDTANNILIKYFSNNTTEYKYNKDKKIYTRYKDGKKHIDENNNEEIIAKNILIQKARTRVIDNEGRREIDIIGSGEGIFITNGKYQKVTWKKERRNSKTRYYDEKGEEIVLNSGVTWIQVVPIDTTIEIS